MKKFVIALLLGLVLVCGCQAAQNAIQGRSVNEIYARMYGILPPVAETEKEETTEAAVQNTRFKDMVPDPWKYFTDTEIEIVTTEIAYVIYVDYVSEDAWNGYIKDCIESGIWSYETYRSDYSWYCDTEDQTYSIYMDRYGKDFEYLTIIVEENYR